MCVYVYVCVCLCVVYTHIYLLCTMFSHFLCLLLILFLAIFVLISIYFYINSDFLLFCGTALAILIRFFPFILPEALCSCVVLCRTSYLASPTVDSVFFPIVIIFCVILLVVWFWFLTICLPFLFLSLIFCYVFLNLWPEVGPDHLSFQHCIRNHRPPEKSWLQWILIGESLYKGFLLKLKTNFTQKPILFKADASYHRTSKTET